MIFIIFVCQITMTKYGMRCIINKSFALVIVILFKRANFFIGESV